MVGVNTQVDPQAAGISGRPAPAGDRVVIPADRVSAGSAGCAAAVRVLSETRPIQITVLPAGRYPEVLEPTAYLFVARISEFTPVNVDIRESILDGRSRLPV